MGNRKYYVGVDLHRNQFTFCAKKPGGEEILGKESIGRLELFAKTVLTKDAV